MDVEALTRQLRAAQEQAEAAAAEREKLLAEVQAARDAADPYTIERLADVEQREEAAHAVNKHLHEENEQLIVALASKDQALQEGIGKLVEAEQKVLDQAQRLTQLHAEMDVDKEELTRLRVDGISASMTNADTSSIDAEVRTLQADHQILLEALASKDRCLQENEQKLLEVEQACMKGRYGNTPTEAIVVASKQLVWNAWAQLHPMHLVTRMMVTWVNGVGSSLDAVGRLFQTAGRLFYYVGRLLGALDIRKI